MNSKLEKFRLNFLSYLEEEGGTSQEKNFDFKLIIQAMIGGREFEDVMVDLRSAIGLMS